jgi:hypothetical protein
MFVDEREKGVERFFASGFIPRLRFCGIKVQLKLIDFGAYPRLLSRRRRVLPLTSEIVSGHPAWRPVLCDPVLYACHWYDSIEADDVRTVFYSQS